VIKLKSLSQPRLPIGGTIGVAMIFNPYNMADGTEDTIDESCQVGDVLSG